MQPPKHLHSIGSYCPNDIELDSQESEQQSSLENENEESSRISQNENPTFGPTSGSASTNNSTNQPDAFSSRRVNQRITGSGSRLSNIPGVFRMPGIRRRSSASHNNRFTTTGATSSEHPLPQAYPVSDLPEAYPVDEVDVIGVSVNDNNNNGSNENEVNNNGHTPRPSSHNRENRSYAFFIALVICAGAILCVLFFLRPQQDKIMVDIKETNETIPSKKDGSNLTTMITAPQEEKEITIIKTKEEEEETIINQESTENFTCYTDPITIQTLEWEANERGDDPSIPRTYHFCRNSVMNVFYYDLKQFNFDFSSGEVKPLVIFRPNINILCGHDGNFQNNCTFSGGFFQVTLNDRPSYVDYNINSTTENITIEGFRFTGVKYGTNIFTKSPVSSLTVKNCSFDNNYNVQASINTGISDTNSSSINIQNSTFHSNLYSYNPYKTSLYVQGGLRSIPNIGIILYNPQSVNGTMRTKISNSLFFNNTFSISSSDINIVTGSPINLPSVASSVIDIGDSCFVGNRGYSSSLILLGRGANTAYHQGNYFSDNVPNKMYGSSCLLNYQDISFVDGWPVDVALEQSCIEYMDTNKSSAESSHVCLEFLQL